MKVEQRLKELGLTLPPSPRPVAAYIPAVAAGGWLYTSGQLPFWEGELRCRGKLGRDLSVAEGYQAARICLLNCLAVIKETAGDLDRVERVVKLTGFVSSAEGFHEQPRVINGASELLGDIFGEAGRHARSAVGVSELPLGASVEVEMIVMLNM